jgi:hypothetical protein
MMDRNGRLRGLIREKFGTYEKLGQEIGISAQGVSEIVAGRSKGATGRYSVAAALGVTVAELWPESEEATAA